ncbi:MAG: hypothetical protein PHC43_01650 [Candidatus Marinimicrobia bacterium]|jgi:hypothetical protein|nr:hypothetical protein [Candidatus Neomarinimicrobiota bacterium]MDD5230013.1 hypothetical protein [Candidatus Neomarinimicrobiota bacterium]MDD5540496.1 hypothetical protein [Candidatus Neomarinimicrobiota bacterium]
MDVSVRNTLRNVIRQINVSAGFLKGAAYSLSMHLGEELDVKPQQFLAGFTSQMNDLATLLETEASAKIEEILINSEPGINIATEIAPGQ